MTPARYPKHNFWELEAEEALKEKKRKKKKRKKASAVASKEL